MLFFYSEEETKYKGGQKAQKVKQYFSPTSMLISKAVCLFKQYSHMHEIFSSQQCAQIHNYKFSMFCLPVQVIRKKKKKKSYSNILCWDSSIGLLPFPYSHKACAYLLFNKQCDLVQKLALQDDSLPCLEEVKLLTAKGLPQLFIIF